MRWNQSSASERRPARWSAVISAADSDSRSGWAAASARSTAAARACSSRRAYAAASSSTEVSRRSSSASAAATTVRLGYAPVSAGPCHSASSYSATASALARWLPASVTNSSKRCASRRLSGIRSTYAAPWVASSTPNALASASASSARSRDTWPWMTVRARIGGSSSHRVLIRCSTGTGRFARSSRAVSRLRRLAGPTDNSPASVATETAPSSRNSTDAAS